MFNKNNDVLNSLLAMVLSAMDIELYEKDQWFLQQLIPM